MDTILKLDENIFFSINNGWSSPWFDWLMIFVTNAGYGAVLVIVGLLFIYFRDNPNFRKTAKRFILTIIIAGIAVQGLKYTIGRERPPARYKQEMKEGKVVVHTPFRKLETRSFPSGHTQVAFTVAAFFALYYKRLAWVLYFGAMLVGISRIYLGVHFPSDVVVGAIIGFAGAWLVWKTDKEAQISLSRENDR